MLTSVLHILDSYRPEDTNKEKEAERLQNIFLKYFEGAVFKEGRIRINLAQVSPVILS